MNNKKRKKTSFNDLLQRSLSSEDYKNLPKLLKASKRRTTMLLKNPKIGTPVELLVLTNLLKKTDPEITMERLITEFKFGTVKKYSYKKN